MHEIKLTDGVTTISLNDGTNVWATGYSLGTPAPGALDCTDSVELLFLVPTTTMRSVEAMLARATQRGRTRRGARIYVTVKLTGDGETWRSELLQGQLMADRLIDDHFIGKVRATLVLQRAPFWEGAEAEIPLTNVVMFGNDDPATGGVAVTNDPEVGAWVEIDSADVAGALPAPVRVRIANATAGELSYRLFWIGNAAFMTLGAKSVIQGEDESTAKGADTASALYSDGAYWTSASFGTTDQLLGVWALGANLAQASEGRWWRLIASLAGHTDAHGPVLWPVIYDATGVQTLWTGPEVRPAAGLTPATGLDFGPIPIPPGPFDADYADVLLGLWGRASAATTIAVDYFYLMPMDAFRKIEQASLGVAAGDWVEFDEIEGRYYQEAAAGRTAVHVPSEAPLVVWPGRDQRVHLLYQTELDLDIADVATVSMWYRPRRLTL